MVEFETFYFKSEFKSHGQIEKNYYTKNRKLKIFLLLLVLILTIVARNEHRDELITRCVHRKI
ncbi:hypothetical protein BpHYR1_009709 [Brachionus plicatilis]|uniref:Uncharacterized protein n=1 Tax=Brachionus plicatilis TaxID=10195 RepID=A0A3M7P284_BRAPC|nr:hypothetical protein BpHYR1_009709 [Brachionus plicatilis]